MQSTASPFCPTQERAKQYAAQFLSRAVLNTNRSYYGETALLLILVNYCLPII